MWYIAAAILVVIAIAIMVLQYTMDRRHLKSKTSEAMSKKLWEEIQEEREASKERRDRFQKALHEAQKDKG